MNKQIKVALADDHPVLLFGMRTAISASGGIKVIWDAGNGNEVLTKIKDGIPDVLILDINMPEIDGIETAKLIRKEYSEVKIVFLTMFHDTQILDTMKRLGVKGYVVKDSALEEIVECIEKVQEGHAYLSSKLTDSLLEGSSAGETTGISYAALVGLTKAERQIIIHIADSLTSSDIADKLCISTRTVENHRANICKKLDLRGNHALFKYAVANREAIQKLVK